MSEICQSILEYLDVATILSLDSRWERICEILDPDHDICFEFSTDIERRTGLKMSREQFEDEYVNSFKPILFTHVTNTWKICKHLSIEDLNSYFGNKRMKVDAKCSGDPEKLEPKWMLNFAEYIKVAREKMTLEKMLHEHQFDLDAFDLPYLFHHIISNEPMATLYTQPSMMKEDIFHCLPSELRPEFRWFTMGHKGSGTALHIDPRGTSAWVALLSGAKRWIFFEDISDDVFYKEWNRKTSALNFWFTIYPTLKNEHGIIHEFVQRPGEVVYVPAGWAHVVLNLDCCISVTENFGEPCHIEYVADSIPEKLLSDLRKYCDANLTSQIESHLSAEAS